MIRTIAAVSGVYDVLIGLTLLLGRQQLTELFGVPAPNPPLHADLNGLFVLVIGIGYVLPYRQPERYRAYLWLMGPLLKGAGAMTFVLDYVLRGSPSAFLLFAASDATLAALTLWALMRTRVRQV